MQSVTLNVAGLYSFPNRLSSIPQGALLKARNIIINRDNIAESRRGMAIYGTAMGGGESNTAHQLLNYKDRILRHWGAGAGTTLEVDSDGAGTFAPFSLTLTGTLSNNSPTVTGFTSTAQLVMGMMVSGTGIPANTTISSITNNTTLVLSQNATVSATESLTFTWTISEVVSGTRLRAIEANSNLYFTSSNGIQKISASNSSNLATAVITNAGGVKALDLEATLNSEEGFFSQESIIAYRLVWGLVDGNNNTILGVPSGRIVISNPLTNLLITDFNKLLSTLDTSNVATGIHAQNYVSSLKVASNSDPSILRANLIGLAAKLDSDISSFTVSAASWSLSVATLTLTSNPQNIISVGDQIKVSGIDPTGFNGTYTVTGVTATTVTYTLASDPGAYVSGGTVTFYSYENITQPSTFNTVPTTDQLISMQNYYDNIVDKLKTSPSGIVTTPSIFYSLNSTQSSTVNLTFSIPPGVTTAHFYQLYRTPLTQVASGTSLSNNGSGVPYDPGDECQLAYEANPTNTDLNNGSITIQDIAPDSFLGAYLYTNPNSGQGINQANEAPPIARDIVTFKDYTFYANTQTRQRLDLSMLSVSRFTSGTSNITITNGTTSNTYTFVIGLAQTQTITTVADVSGSLNSKYFTLNNGRNLTSYYVWYSNGAGVDPAPGGTGVQVTFATNDTAATIATKTTSALNQIGDFITSVTSNVITVTNVTAGISTAAANGAASPGFTYSVTVTGQGEDSTNKKVLFTPVSSGTISNISVANPTVITTSGSHGLTTGQLVQILASNSTPNINGLYAVTVTGSNTFTVPVNVTVSGNFATWAVAPVYTPSQQITETSQSLIRVINKNASEIVTAQYLSGPTDIPGQMLFEAKQLSYPVFWVNANSTATGSQFNPQLPTSGSTVSSSNEVEPHRLYYSKYQQPEAVPLLNYIDIGPKDKNILRVLALRDNLFILKEEGIYRLSGLTTPFTVIPFDFSTILKAPDSAGVLNNLIYMFSNQGVATISDTGVAVISRPIENELLKLVSYSNFISATFGVTYESDRSYYLFTLTNSTDTYATQCFRFNTFTNTWTVLDFAKRSGIVNTADDKLYLAATDTNYIEQERKSFDRTDYADRALNINFGVNFINGTSVVLPSIVGVSVGDVLAQTQYLTCNVFNLLLTKLDLDSRLSNKNYVSTLKANAGVNLSQQLDLLITKIANDAGRLAVVGSTPAATYTALSPTGLDFPSQQTNFNNLIALLNNDIGLGSHNFPTSMGTVTYEFNILTIDNSNNNTTSPYPYPLIQGAAIIYKAIPTDLQFVPQYFGDTSMTKQVSEGTFIFEDSGFTNATISYSSDLSGSFDAELIPGNGSGTFGSLAYGTGYFGGADDGVPFRTLIPKAKQRCRYLSPRFQHTIAREQFALYGVSLTYRPVSQRGWR